jgi:hypothetical protein
VRRAGLVAIAVILAGAAALPLLGGDGGDQADEGRNLPGTFRGASSSVSQAPDADCDGWRAGTPAQRRRAVADIEAAFGRNGKGAVLPADQASATFDRACAEEFAGPFKLWKLYEHALAFQYPQREGA